jgi:hypothetical protein
MKIGTREQRGDERCLLQFRKANKKPTFLLFTILYLGRIHYLQKKDGFEYRSYLVGDSFLFPLEIRFYTSCW